MSKRILVSNRVYYNEEVLNKTLKTKHWSGISWEKKGNFLYLYVEENVSQGEEFMRLYEENLLAMHKNLQAQRTKMMKEEQAKIEARLREKGFQIEEVKTLPSGEIKIIATKI